MKKLEISQMENLQGFGPNRNCLLIGASTVVGFVAGIASGGAAWYAFGSAAWLTGLGKDCF